MGFIILNEVAFAAGAVITKDVPDYCILGGVPAKVINEKCSKEEALMMNRIAWWNWDDEKIQQRIADFQLSIPEFIVKYQ